MATKKARRKTGAGLGQRTRSQTIEDIRQQQQELQKRVREEQLKGVVAAAPHGRKPEHHEAVWLKVDQEPDEPPTKVTKRRRKKAKKRRVQARDRDDMEQLNAVVPKELMETLRYLAEARETSITRPFSQRAMIELAVLEWAQQAIDKLGKKPAQGMTKASIRKRIADLQR